jgi:hypothetical protein
MWVHTGVDKIGADRLQERREVSRMQKLLALAVLGASLALTASAAFADVRGYVERVSQFTQDVTVAPQYVEPMSGVAGGPAQVDQSEFREGSNAER